jgi:hypothetical protein
MAKYLADNKGLRRAVCHIEILNFYHTILPHIPLDCNEHDSRPTTNLSGLLATCWRNPCMMKLQLVKLHGPLTGCRRAECFQQHQWSRSSSGASTAPSTSTDSTLAYSQTGPSQNNRVSKWKIGQGLKYDKLHTIYTKYDVCWLDDDAFGTLKKLDARAFEKKTASSSIL